jgi:hypothetical protein
MNAIRVLANASCIFVVVLAHEPVHAGDEAWDLPDGFMSSATALSSARVQCSRVLPLTSPRRAKCTIVQTLLTRPGPDKVAKDIAELDKALSGSAGAKFLTDACGPQKSRDQAPSIAPTSRENQITATILEACRKRDVSAMRQAMLERIKFDSEVCTVDTTTDEYEFTRTNRDTWTFASPAGAWCGGSFTTVLWRDAKNKHLWNYKQVRSLPPNATDPLSPDLCPLIAKTPLVEMSSHVAPIRELACRFIKL